MKSHTFISALVLFSIITQVLFACGRIKSLSGPLPESSRAQTSSIIANLDSPNVDFLKPTHVFLIGYSKGMGNQFFQSAVAKGLRYRELYSEHQIVFIRNRETGSDADLLDITRLGVQVVSADLSKITDTALVVYLDQYQKIESFDIYSHTSPWGAGLEVDQIHTRLGTSTPNLELLADNFAPFAYVTINGCNNGLYMAPVLSQVWRVPVSGALASTDFQQLHENGKWYFNNPGQSPTGRWANSNAVSYSVVRSCLNGACVRMKPENVKYQGLWGNFVGGGLPFYKFFCNYEGGFDDCLSAMARNLIASVSIRELTLQSSIEAYRDVVFDSLCPIDPNLPIREKCIAGIQKAISDGTLVYSPFFDNPLECNMKGCQFEFKCQNDADGYPVPGSCSLFAPPNLAPKTITEEYMRYMRGFELLKRIQE